MESVVSLDMGIIYKGFNLDAALTLPVLIHQEDALLEGHLLVTYKKWAKDNPKLHKLLETTKEALNA